MIMSIKPNEFTLHSQSADVPRPEGSCVICAVTPCTASPCQGQNNPFMVVSARVQRMCCSLCG